MSYPSDAIARIELDQAQGVQPLCQGPESWTQLDSTGWALVDEDHRYLRNKMQDGDMIVRVIRAYALAGSEHETPRNESELAPAGTMAALAEARKRLADFEIGPEGFAQ